MGNQSNACIHLTIYEGNTFVPILGILQSLQNHVLHAEKLLNEVQSTRNRHFYQMDFLCFFRASSACLNFYSLFSVDASSVAEASDSTS